MGNIVKENNMKHRFKFKAKYIWIILLILYILFPLSERNGFGVNRGILGSRVLKLEAEKIESITLNNNDGYSAVYYPGDREFDTIINCANSVRSVFWVPAVGNTGGTPYWANVSGYEWEDNLLFEFDEGGIPATAYISTAYIKYAGIGDLADMVELVEGKMPERQQ